MDKKTGPMAYLLFFTGLVCIAFLFFFGFITLREIDKTKRDLQAPMEQLLKEKQELEQAVSAYTSVVEKKEASVKYAQQKAATYSQGNTRERAPQTQEQQPKASVFDESDSGEDDELTGSPTLASAEGNGHIVGIDPGHQSERVDMSASEPLGPGSSQMKAKATSGTQGYYTGVPEYRLNLDISLLLQEELKKRGYQVILTRTDNDTAISNKERAQLVSEQGADIYVRIHANGDDSHTATGALAISPSSQNPYVSDLFESSDRLSQCILNAYCETTGFANLGVIYQDNMTGINWSTVPVTILEMGFMTNESDDTRMNDSSFRTLMVQGIADGIDDYFA